MTAHFQSNKNKHLYFIFLLLFLPLLFQSCVVSRPRYKSIASSDTFSQFKVIHKPYYKKELSGFGKFCAVFLPAAGASAGYVFGDQAGISNKYAGAGAGAIAGYGLSRLAFVIGGNKKERKLKGHGEYQDWLDKYSDENSTNWVLINIPTLGGDTAIWAIERAREKSFVPSSYDDVTYFAAAFPNSQYLHQVILTANKIISKEDLKKLITQFPNHPAIAFTKIELVNRSQSEAEIKALVIKYPETASQAEKKYAELVQSYDYLLAFVLKYPKSNYTDIAVLHAIYRMSHEELKMIDMKARGLSKPSIYMSEPVKLKLQLALVEYSETYNEMMKTIHDYPNTPFVVRFDAKIEDLDSAKAIYERLINYKPTIQKSGIKKVATDLKAQYLKNRMDYPENLFEQMIGDDKWLKEGLPPGMFDSIALIAVKVSGTDYFTGTGKWENIKPQGKGKYYRTNGQISEGNFIDGKLHGQGIKLKTEFGERLLYEGEFNYDELNGRGRMTSQRGTIYEGIFKNDVMEGKGRILYKDGSYDTGYFSNFKLEGLGERKSRRFTYIGGFKSGKFEGIGKYQSLNDSSNWFKGHFTGGKRNGPGELHISPDFLVRGTWLNDCPENTINLFKYSETDKTFKPIGTWKISKCTVLNKSADSNVFKVNEAQVMEKTWVDYSD